MTHDGFGTAVIIISREEVERRDTTATITALKEFISSPESIRKFRERVDIAFDGFNDTRWELFEIPEVRSFVHSLDAEFPYWLYFLSRYYTGLQCLTLCFLPPHLKEEARQQIHPPRFAELVEHRWGPALNAVCHAAGLRESDADELLESAINYFYTGPTDPVVRVNPPGSPKRNQY